MRNVLFDCVDSIYIYNDGSLCLALTQDMNHAQEIGVKYLQNQDINPYWWEQGIPLTTENMDRINTIITEINNRLGGAGVSEFCELRDNVFYIKGFSLF